MSGSFIWCKVRTKRFEPSSPSVYTEQVWCVLENNKSLTSFVCFWQVLLWPEKTLRAKLVSRCQLQDGFSEVLNLQTRETWCTWYVMSSVVHYKMLQPNWRDHITLFLACLHWLPVDFITDFRASLLKHLMVWFMHTFVSFWAHMYLHSSQILYQKSAEIQPIKTYKGDAFNW